MTSLDTKFIVFRSEDVELDEHTGQVIRASRPPLAPDSYFVLRQNDVFASQHLSSYGLSLVNLIEAVILAGTRLPDEVEKHLSKTADGAMSLAEKWMASNQRHIPT